MSKPWGYTELNGPHVWPDLYPEAGGYMQSPIDINPAISKESSELSENPLRWSYIPENTRSLANPGYCWKVDVDGRGSELTGGPLMGDTFILEQFHCHWGCSDGHGSEHTVEGEAFPAEMHLVHWNVSKYNSIQEAAGEPDGICAVGVFFKTGEPHPELEKITKLLPYVKHKGDKVTIPEPLDPAKLLPSNRAYWTYLGSLTTPPCTESVIWVVFKEPIEVSQEQLEQFRQLCSYGPREDCPCDDEHRMFDYGKVVNNYRPPLPLKDRELREYGGH